ncbi:MAG: DivIVA domain-containing protein, partial [Bdellovibrionaceae bacterium]|nr:DivIVA domain-containing protein [Pseudobdellovibrionaceae bacterium]MDW8191271.1 DivIVA domain-containing protein [Pseudobdellovibrionaceae bacterium]
MKITPVELHQKVFQKSVFGYDPDEVDQYLRQIAGYLETLLSEQMALKDALREKDLQILNYKEREQSLQDAITGAKQMAEKMREDAQREARLIISDAEHKAEALV